MEYIIWIPAILGLLAFLSIGELKARISRLEDQLGKVKDSPAHQEKISLMKVLQDYTGKEVILEFRGDQFDQDLGFPPSSCTVLAADEDWVMVRIATQNGDTEKLFRLQQISGVKGTI